MPAGPKFLAAIANRVLGRTTGLFLWSVSLLIDCLVEGDSAAPDLGQDGFCGGDPHEGLGFVVVDLHVFLDWGDQLRDGVEYAPA